MAKEIIRRIIDLIVKAQDLASSIGIGNILQPGLIKEMIIAEVLGHKIIYSKRHADACDPDDPSIQFEYLSCKEGGTFQLDRMFKEPSDKRAESLTRISRNRKMYFAIFYGDNQIKLKSIYEVDPKIVLEEAERQLNRSRNAISHIGFSIPWAVQNGRLIHQVK